MDGAFVLTTFWRLIGALPLTLEVWALSVAIGGVFAFGLTAARLSGSPALRGFARAYVFVFRGAPLLVQLFVVYYGLASFAAVRASPLWPFLRDAFDCAVLSLALCTAAYQSEIFRMAVIAIPHGQIEAARACGMSGFTLLRRLLLPIAFRQALPAYVTELISMVKATALVSLVTLWDVMSVALKIRNDTLVTYTPLLVAGAIYFVVNYLIARLGAALEYVLSPHLRGRPVLPQVADVL